jgi:hypothetical protein
LSCPASRIWRHGRKNKRSFFDGNAPAAGASSPATCSIAGPYPGAHGRFAHHRVGPMFFSIARLHRNSVVKKGAKTSSNRERQLDSTRLCIRNPSGHCPEWLLRPLGRTVVCHPTPRLTATRRGTGVVIRCTIGLH